MFDRPHARERLNPREILVVALFAALALAPGIASLPVVDRDEARYAVATTQMLLSGDFIDIRYQDTYRYLQPAGIYWLQSLSVWLFSSPEAKEIWAFRLPSLLSAIGASVLTAFLGARYFGRTAGLAAGIMVAACLSLGFEARIAKIDAALLLAILSAQAALMTLYLDAAGTRPRLVAAAFWAALGVGMMLKGPIILIIVGATIAALVLWDRKLAWLKRLRAGWGAALMIAIVAPWYVAIGFHSDGLFYEIAIGKSMLQKVGKSQQGHAGPFGYHLALFPIMFWPSSLFALWAAPFAWTQRTDPRVKFLLCWIVPTWLIFEIVSTKLPHYVLPTYPALAILAAGALFSAGWRPGRIYAVAVSALWLLATLVVAALAPYVLSEAGEPIDFSTFLAPAILMAASVGALVFLWSRRPERAVALTGGAAVLAGLLLYVGGLPSAKAFWLSPRIAAAAAEHAPCPGAALVTTPYHEPSLVFLHGPFRTTLAISSEDAAQKAAQAPACSLALIASSRAEAFLAEAERLGLSARQVDEIRGINYADEANDEPLRLYAFDRD